MSLSKDPIPSTNACSDKYVESNMELEQPRSLSPRFRKELIVRPTFSES